ncbi:hypothetical protein BH20ACT5_BH20ACT5_17060 [soil metagenome]
MSQAPEDYGDQQPETGTTVQLDNEETLDGPIGEDPLDAGYIANDRPTAVTDWGTTAEEAAAGEPLDSKLAAEQPDVPERDEHRSGRLVAEDEGVREDHTAQLVADDVGIDGGAASAEEAAVHVQGDPAPLASGDDPTSTGAPVHPAGEGVSDEDMADAVAEQTDSASTNADTAGKDWNA